MVCAEEKCVCVCVEGEIWLSLMQLLTKYSGDTFVFSFSRGSVSPQVNLDTKFSEAVIRWGDVPWKDEKGRNMGCRASQWVTEETSSGLSRQNTGHGSRVATLPYWIQPVDKKKSCHLQDYLTSIFSQNWIHSKPKACCLRWCLRCYLLRGGRQQAIGSAAVSPIPLYFQNSQEMKAQPWPQRHCLWKGLAVNIPFCFPPTAFGWELICRQLCHAGMISSSCFVVLSLWIDRGFCLRVVRWSVLQGLQRLVLLSLVTTRG